MLKNIKPAGTKNPLSTKEKTYIRANYERHTVPQMALSLARSSNFVYDYMKEAHLTPLKLKIEPNPDTYERNGFFDEKAYSRITQTI